MSNRELWQNIMHYGHFDRMPVVHWKGWPETIERWHNEGLPPEIDEHQYFDAVPHWLSLKPNLGIFPPFEEQIIEETDDYRIFRDGDGVVQQDWKNRSCIPHYIDMDVPYPALFVEFYGSRRKNLCSAPQQLIADKGSNSDPLRKRLACRGIELICP